MPLHRNECIACGTRFRVLDLPGVEDDPVCPACGARNARRLLPRVAVQFKGSGFYRTDHGRGAGGGSKSGEDANGGETAPSSEN